MTTHAQPTPPTPFDSHARSYPRFVWHVLRNSFGGSPRFYAWMTVLTAIMLVGANAWAEQVARGMALTGMSDHVSWGLYIANFTFGVGLAAGAVLLVIPAYLYDDHEMHGVVIVGELVAIAAISVCLLFITVDLGRPDRFWHIIPGLGRFNWMYFYVINVLLFYILWNYSVRFKGFLQKQKTSKGDSSQTSQSLKYPWFRWVIALAPLALLTYEAIVFQKINRIRRHWPHFCGLI